MLLTKHKLLQSDLKNITAMFLQIITTMYFKLSTYDPEKLGKNAQFYIQSKGNNAGQPLRNPKRNSWIVETNVPNAFEICTVLWIAKTYEQDIIGTVVPFLRMHDYLKITLPYLAQSADFTQAIEQSLKSIYNIDKLIDTTLTKLKLAKELKIVTAYQVLKKIQSVTPQNEKTPV